MPNPLRRIVAQVVDFSVIALWALAAAVVGLVLFAAGIRLENPWLADAVAFATLVAPALVSFALFESSRWQATPGKRLMGLVVVDERGSRLTRSRALIRSGFKFLPWQLGHTAVFHIVAGSASPALFVLSAASQTIVGLSVVTMLLRRDRRALHDLVVRTTVVDPRTTVALLARRPEE